MAKEFLVAYDYGMGGLWAVVSANFASEIANKHPELVVVDERPSWMTNQHYDQLLKREHHDVNETPPQGVLGVIVAERNKT